MAVIIDGLTNNRARTASELRTIFERNGGKFASSGAVAFQFSKRGVITIKADAIAEETLIELALDAGADDVTNEGEAYAVLISPTTFHKVKDSIAAANVPIEGSDISHIPSTSVDVDADTARRILKLVDDLEDNDDVQTVSHNAILPEG